MPEQVRRHDRVTTAVELGPRSLALLRRILFALEKIAELEPTEDLGKDSEDVTAEWPAN